MICRLQIYRDNLIKVKYKNEYEIQFNSLSKVQKTNFHNLNLNETPTWLSFICSLQYIL